MLRTDADIADEQRPQQSTLKGIPLTHSLRLLHRFALRLVLRFCETDVLVKGPILQCDSNNRRDTHAPHV